MQEINKLQNKTMYNESNYEKTMIAINTLQINNNVT